MEYRRLPPVLMRSMVQNRGLALERKGILGNVGLSELVAGSVEEYVEIACALAQDGGRMTALRAGMRERMKRSALMDLEGFVREVEAAYRGMWEQFCRNG
jgi:predicted O-linked N-acetylglucosamine transferase (SPINDLY family)